MQVSTVDFIKSPALYLEKVKTTVWDPAEHLETDEEITTYLSDIFATNDTQLIVAAIGDAARARGK